MSIEEERCKLLSIKCRACANAWLRFDAAWRSCTFSASNCCILSVAAACTDDRHATSQPKTQAWSLSTAVDQQDVRADAAAVTLSSADVGQQAVHAAADGLSRADAVGNRGSSRTYQFLSLSCLGWLAVCHIWTSTVWALNNLQHNPTFSCMLAGCANGDTSMIAGNMWLRQQR